MTNFQPFPLWQWQVPEYFNIGTACTQYHKKNPSHLAMIVEDEKQGTSQMTFAELALQTDKFANLLHELDIKKGERVLIRLPNSLYYPIAFLGTMKQGAISVPTSTLLTAEEVAYLAQDSSASVLVTDSTTWEGLQKHQQEIKNLRHILLIDKNETITQSKVHDLQQALAKTKIKAQAVQTKADDPAYLVYTSGTTGYPKGVLHAHRALIGRTPASKYWFDFQDENDRIMHSGKFNWTYVLGSGLMDPLYLGKTVIVHEGKNSAETWIELIKKHSATIFIGVPTIYRQIIQKTNTTQADVPSLKHCMSAGEHLSDEVFIEWQKRFNMAIYEAVGMSEFSYYLCQTKSRPIRPGSAGFPQPGHEIQLLNPETQQVVPVGEEGMICVPESDPGLFIEYWNLPEETAKLKNKGWFFTGDYARYDVEGYIWFLGRKDDIIKSFGYRVSPYEIERVLKSHPGVADCAVIGEEIEKDKILVTAYIIPQADNKIQADDFILYGREHLASYKAPKTVYFVKDFPRTKNGKILRKNIHAKLAYAKSTIR